MSDDLAPTFLPPVEGAPAPKPERSYPRCIPWLAIALTPVVAVCTAVGAYTIAHGVIRSTAPCVAATEFAHKRVVHLKDSPSPRYNLAGYQTAISGSDEQAFIAALNKFRADAKRYKFQALSSDALTLTNASNSWLALLRKTTPPPGYQASKLDYIMAATLANRAATKTQGGIASADLNALAQGSALATQAKQALARAAESAPHGS